jgi:hypothetical protein
MIGLATLTRRRVELEVRRKGPSGRVTIQVIMGVPEPDEPF